MSDAAYLAYDLTSVNVPDASSLPVTATWRTQDGTVARVDTIPAGQLTGTLLWPGMVLNAQGVAVGWPGWRDLQPSDFPLAPGARIYGTQIEDASLPSYAYRLPMTVTFSINPTAVVDVLYPDVTPAGCAVPRDPALSISKTASGTSITPGQHVHLRDHGDEHLDARRRLPGDAVGPDPRVTCRITGIATSDSAFPRWINCAVTGTDGDGYGGTLNCAAQRRARGLLVRAADHADRRVPRNGPRRARSSTRRRSAGRTRRIRASRSNARRRRSASPCPRRQRRRRLRPAGHRRADHHHADGGRRGGRSRVAAARPAPPSTSRVTKIVSRWRRR